MSIEKFISSLKSMKTAITKHGKYYIITWALHKYCQVLTL